MSSNFPRVPGVRLEVTGSGPLASTAQAFVEDALAATGALRLEDRGHEWRAILALSLQPDIDDPLVPATLLRWAEVQAQTVIQRARAPMARAGRPAKRVSILFCVDDPPEEPAVLEAFEAASLAFAVAEDEMSRPTRDAPDIPFPAGVSVLSWDEASALLFHRAYLGAFADRPGSPNWDKERWRSSFTADAAFRPDLSAVVVGGGEPAAFEILWLEEGTGWVTQIGVVPAWRGKNLGEALLSHALRSFAAEGVETAALEVAVNNPAARALYERMGFEVSGSYRSWRKTLG